MIKVTDYGKIIRLDLARSFLGKGYYWTSAYYFDGLLIDSGCAHAADELGKVLREKRLLKIVNTHSHEDHIGGNSLLYHQRPEMKIFAHPLALEVLENPEEKQPLQLYRKLFWGCPKPSHADPIYDRDVITTDQHSLRVIYTPGHSPDHLCLYEPARGWLFTGDLFVGGRDRMLGAGYDIWEIINSLRRVAELPITSMFPGSARVREDPLPDLLEKIAYLEELGHKAIALHGKGMSVGTIARTLCGEPMLIELLTCGRFSRRQLILSYLRGTDQE